MGYESRNNPLAQAPPPDRNTVYDSYGRALHLGDRILLPGATQPAWVLAKAPTPVLDPRAPQGVVELTLVSSMVVHVRGGQPWADAVRVLTAEELGAAPTNTPDSAPTLADPAVGTAPGVILP